MIFLASEFKVRVVLGLGGVKSFNIFDVLKLCSNTATIKMASMPMGVHAAFKIRDHMNGNSSSQEKERYTSSFQAQPSSMSTETKVNQPAQYNGKLMNSIWGMYNRYSVHNIKSHIAYDKA